MAYDTVVFSGGVHYVVGEDGNADMSQPLRWTPDGYRAAGDDDPLHNDTFHGNDLDLEVGGEG